MPEWLAENWKLLLTIIYATERISALVKEFTKRLTLVMDTVEREDVLNEDTVAPTAKELLPENLKGDIIIDTILDSVVDPKDGSEKPRVSRKRRAGNILIHAIPLLSRILDR